MLNTIELIGRLVADPEVKVLDDGQKVSNITLAVHRPFKNQDGEYGVDFIPVSFWYGTAILTEQYCFKGDLIFMRGRIVDKVQTINNINYHFAEIIGERVIFLGHKSKLDDETMKKANNIDLERK